MRKFWQKFKELIFIKPSIYIALGVIFVLSILIIYWPLIIVKLGWQGETMLNEEMSSSSNYNNSVRLVNKKGKLSISKIKVNAPIILMEWSDKATDSEIQDKIQKYLEKGVGHYPGTALPGEIGNVFITGHSSNYSWVKGSYNYVFASLNDLEKGNKVIIYFNNTKFIYEVYNKEIISPKDNKDALKQSNDSILTLMTCTPTGTDLYRLVVRCRQISPNPSSNVPSYIY